MILRRFVSTFIDFIIAFIPVTIVEIILKNSEPFVVFDQGYLLKLVSLFFLHTSLSLIITKKQTVGEKFLKIKITSINNDEIDVKTIVLRNIAFFIYIPVIIFSIGDILGLTIFVMLFILSNALIFSKNRHNKYMNLFDFVFKTYYAKC